jgi:hypothetical protein
LETPLLHWIGFAMLALRSREFAHGFRRVAAIVIFLLAVGLALAAGLLSPSMWRHEGHLNGVPNIAGIGPAPGKWAYRKSEYQNCVSGRISPAKPSLTHFGCSFAGKTKFPLCHRTKCRKSSKKSRPSNYLVNNSAGASPTVVATRLRLSNTRTSWLHVQVTTATKP